MGRALHKRRKRGFGYIFSGCNLRCEFCQNYDISHQSKGKEYSKEEFLELIKGYDLPKYTCIEFITPTHFSSQILAALQGQKFSIPIVWNSGGYEKPEMIEKLASVVDVFMPDFKYCSSQLSEKYSLAKDYFDYASKAIIKMREMKKTNIFKDGIMQSGVLIRHLVLPNCVKDSIEILNFIKENIANPFISLMSQFIPCNNCSIQRKLYPLEYKLVLSHAEKIGLSEGYLQDYASASENFIPQF